MTDKLHCPFCSKELTIQPRKVANFEIAVCRNPVCKYAGWHLPAELWQDLARTRKALKIAVDALKSIDWCAQDYAKAQETLDKITALEQKD